MGPRIARAGTAVAALALGGFLLGACGSGDTGNGAVSATGEQGQAANQDVMRRIRQALANDNALSASAKNVQIITTQQGQVTLRGQVPTSDEKDDVMDTARDAAGDDVRVVDELQVASR